MKPKTDIAGNERGFVLIATMVILLLLLVLGLSANTTSSIDLQLAGNDKTSQMAFFNADAGIYSSPKMISAAIAAGEASSFNPGSMYGSNLSSFPTVDSDFYNEIMGFDTSSATFTFPLDSQTVSVSILRTGQQVLAGGGAEFASGASGVGSGSDGGVAIDYSLDSTGPASDSARSELYAEYRKVPGVAGGL